MYEDVCVCVWACVCVCVVSSLTSPHLVSRMAPTIKMRQNKKPFPIQINLISLDLFPAGTIKEN